MIRVCVDFRDMEIGAKEIRNRTDCPPVSPDDTGTTRTSLGSVAILLEISSRRITSNLGAFVENVGPDLILARASDKDIQLDTISKTVQLRWSGP